MKQSNSNEAIHIGFPVDISQSPYTRLARVIDDTLFAEFEYEWMMTQAERCLLIWLLEKIRPEVSIEIGTAGGGSLSVIAQFSNEVFSIDPDPSCAERFRQKFKNVKFLTGKSQVLLPSLLEEQCKIGKGPSFVLIDGAHQREAVRQDICNLLKVQPTQPMWVIMHDSYNPGCRQGIIEGNWAENSYVHYVELDFVPGRFNAETKEMWCGFAIALLLPFKREHNLTIHKEHEVEFQTMVKISAHQKRLGHTIRLAVREVVTKVIAKVVGVKS